ncbi:glycosyltransferase family 2 protein [Methylorubrum populi]|uniref:glycosyltransferase family 2 protein n=1 Tax=Methylorubrum populi TaxID=223967 RepID=UPI001153D240|nr:glycosyltransferase family A protein [Methylorubrum populi]QDI82176.1 glycosyltransferase family 2 protein [Methylorubrum populi]
MDGIEVSFVVNLHREGRLCIASLTSAVNAVQFASRSGIPAELLIVLDNPDDATLSIAERFSRHARLLLINVKDLGEARNHGVSCSRGQYVAFMDGDDLCCRNWLVAAYNETGLFSRSCIVHPQFNLFFGRNYSRYFWVHPDMRKDDIRLSRLLVENLWTSSVFSEKKIFVRVPYIRNDIKNGLGYEDWVFNVETSTSGINHITAPDTILFIRRNKEASLLVESGANAVIPAFNKLFDKSQTSFRNINARLYYP